MNEQIRYQLERISRSVEELTHHLRRTKLLLAEVLDELAELQDKTPETRAAHPPRQQTTLARRLQP